MSRSKTIANFSSEGNICYLNTQNIKRRTSPVLQLSSDLNRDIVSRPAATAWCLDQWRHFVCAEKQNKSSVVSCYVEKKEAHMVEEFFLASHTRPPDEWAQKEWQKKEEEYFLFDKFNSSLLPLAGLASQFFFRLLVFFSHGKKRVIHSTISLLLGIFWQRLPSSFFHIHFKWKIIISGSCAAVARVGVNGSQQVGAVHCDVKNVFDVVLDYAFSC